MRLRTGKRILSILQWTDHPADEWAVLDLIIFTMNKRREMRMVSVCLHV